MATAEEYAAWIVANRDKKGTPEFKTVSDAYRLVRSGASPQAEAKGPSQSYVAGLAKSAANSPIIGLGDEATGAFQSVMPYPIGPGGGGVISGIPERYRMARDSERIRQKEFAQDYPGSDLAASVVPAMVSGPGLLRGGKQVATKFAPGLSAKIAGSPGARYVAGITGGTGGGLLGGYGYGDEASDAGMGALIGFGLSAAIPPLAGVSGYLGNKVAQGYGAAADLLRSPAKRFGRKMAQALDRDMLTPKQLQKGMRELGPEAMPIDVSPNVGSMGRTYAQSEGKAKAVATKALRERAEGAQKRIVRDLFDATDVQDVDIDSAVQRLHQNMREIGKGYDDILNTGIVEMDEGLEQLMGSRTMKQALGQAYAILDDDIALRRADKKLQMYFKPTDNDEAMFAPMIADFGEMAKRPTLRVWDYVKRGLDAIVSDGTDATTGKLSSKAERAYALKRELLKKIDDRNPNYAKIRSAYADKQAAERAMMDGRRFMRDDAETTARKIADMDGGEKEYYRIGAARFLRDKVMNRQEQFKQWKANPLEKEKIRSLMGKERGNKFIKRLETESTFNASKNRTLAGSQTFETTQAAAEASQDPAGLLKLQGGPASMLMGLIQKDASKIPAGMIDAGADVLYSPQSINQLPGLLNQPLATGPGPFHMSPERFYGGLLGATPQASGVGAR